MKVLHWAAVAALLATPAGAVTRCVNPSGTGGCSSTIQAAVTASAAGDIILVRPGVYNENVVVPAGKDRLQIGGAGIGITILDPDVPLAGVGITINSSSVTVRSLTVRNGQSAGILVNGNSAVLQGLDLVAQRGAGMSFAASTTGHRILSNSIRGVVGTGIDLPSANDRSVVRGNRVTQVGGAAIRLAGADLQVLSNRVTGAVEGIVFVALSDRARVAGNIIEQVSEDGLVVAGDNMTVSANSLTNAGPLRIYGAPTFSAGTVTANSSTGSNSYGFYMSVPAAGLVFQGNRATGAQTGLYTAGTGIVVSRNVIADSGLGPSSPCFYIMGSEQTVTANTATRCGDSGFIVQGSHNVLDANVATGAGVSGYLVNGGAGANTDVVLTRNRASQAAGQGFAVVNGAVRTVLTGNTALGHRTDFCDEGSDTDTTGGNTFGSSGPTCYIVD